eukprot:4445268-Lingulodinium_polyedra.AAC.1
MRAVRGVRFQEPASAPEAAMHWGQPFEGSGSDLGEAHEGRGSLHGCPWCFGSSRSGPRGPSLGS